MIVNVKKYNQLSSDKFVMIHTLKSKSSKSIRHLYIQTRGGSGGVYAGKHQYKKIIIRILIFQIHLTSNYILHLHVILLLNGLKRPM